MYSHPGAKRPFQKTQRGRPKGSTKAALFFARQLRLELEAVGVAGGVRNEPPGHAGIANGSQVVPGAGEGNG